MQVFYINLAHRTDRRAFMEEQFVRLGISAERVEAATPSDIGAEDLEQYCNDAREVWMPAASFACNLSHIRVWEQMVVRGVERALVLEDDAVLSSALPDFLALIDARPRDYSIIRIETLNGELRLMPPEDQVSPRFALRKSRSWDCGAAGYIIDLKTARMLAASSEMRTQLVDTLIFNAFGETARRISVVYTDPGLCIQLMHLGEHGAAAASDLRLQRPGKGQWARRHPIRRFFRRVQGWGQYDIKLLADWLFLRAKGLRNTRIKFLP